MKIVTVENKKEWDNLLFQCKNVSLLQTWEYGEAKKNAEGWLPIRSVLLCEDKPVGVVQTLTKKIPLLGVIARINRAPLIISDNESCYELTVQILKFLHNYWVRQKKVILFIAPNIVQGGVDDRILQESGYNRINKEAWTSITIDLRSDETTLRKALHQKWRNVLNKSEKMGLELETENSDDGLLFLMSKYNELKIKKKFSGPPERLILEIKKATTGKASMEIFFAVKDGVRIGGILVVGYIDTCHYLIGWNTDAGRNYGANYFLLWHALLTFKKMGYRWLDLGGINEKLTPSIAHFKRGLGGKEYMLIGEFEAFPSGFFSLLARKIIKLGTKYNRG